MAAVKTITFIVRGRYGFPFDMLRYDQAWPTGNGASALSMITRDENHDVNGKLTPVDIELQTNSGRVTDDRWHSFGWIVTSDRKGI